MTWQRGPRPIPDPYVVALAIIDAAVTAAAADADINGLIACRTMPATRPAKVVQVRIDGGDVTTQGLVAVSTVSFRVWAATDAKAGYIARFVHGALLNPATSVGGVKVSSVASVLLPIDVVDPLDPDTTTYFGRVALGLRS